MTVGSRRSGLNQNMALKEQYERALQDLTDLVDTAKDKMAADHRIVASSVEEVQNHLDKHKVRVNRVKTQLRLLRMHCCSLVCVCVCVRVCVCVLGVLPGSGVPHDPHGNVLQEDLCSDAS